MTEFTPAEQMYLTQGMSPQQSYIFQAQYASLRKDRNLILVLSIFFGYLGVDRFLVGDIAIGLLKFFTGGLFGILWFIDWFLIRGRADEYNRRKANEIAMAVSMNTPPV